MKLIISRTSLTELIGKIQSIVPVKPSLPVLANILLEAVDDQLILSATDLMVSIRAFTDAKILEEGSITLPAKRFFQLVRELTAPQIELHAATPETIFINSGSSHFKIHGMHKLEFPTLPNFSDGIRFTLLASLVKEIFSRTSFSAARDEQQKLLNSIYFEYQNELASFIATDGKRVAKFEVPLQLPIPNCSLLLPIKAVEEILKLIDGEENNVLFILMPDKCAVEIGPITLMTQLLSGKYPDLSQVLPKKSSTPIAIHREELISLLRQISLFTSSQSAPVKFSFSSGELYLSAMSGAIGEGTVNMPVNYAGEKIDIAINPHHFLDVLRHSNDEVVHFDLFGSYNPSLVTDSTSAQFTLIPMRLDAF